MDFTNWTIAQLNERRSAIMAELETDGADLDALQEEARKINEELEKRRTAEAQRAAIRNDVAGGAGVIATPAVFATPATPTNEEVRSSAAYIDAFADYIRTGDDRECRTLLTENVNGIVPVPVLVDEIIRHAWENEQILSRTRKTYIRGNLKVAFELSVDPAHEHTEGTAAPAEENITLGIVTMVPKNIKKWIRLSDEAVTMGGEAFLRYVYEELTYQIIKLLSSLVVADVTALPTASTATTPYAAKISAAPGLTTVHQAFANLSDEADNPVIVMNKLTYADFIAAQAAGNFSFDPFMGLPVAFTSALPAYSAASSGDVYMFVGDMKGEQINYPEGEGIILKWDDLTEAQADLVKIVGRQYTAHAVTAPGRFVNVAKA